MISYMLQQLWQFPQRDLAQNSFSCEGPLNVLVLIGSMISVTLIHSWNNCLYLIWFLISVVSATRYFAWKIATASRARDINRKITLNDEKNSDTSSMISCVYAVPLILVLAVLLLESVLVFLILSYIVIFMHQKPGTLLMLDKVSNTPTSSLGCRRTL